MDQQKNMICTSSFIYVNVSLKLFIQSPECLKETTLALHSNLSWFTLFCSTLTSEIEKSAVIFTPDERLSFRNCFGFCRICSLVDWKIIDCVVHLIRFLKCYLIVESVTSHRIQRVEFLFNPNSKALFLPSLLFCEILNFTSILKKSPKTIK